jgi:acyl-CoA thioesterase-1
MRRSAALVLGVLCAAAARAQHVYVAFGDSITFGYAVPAAPQSSYPAQLQNLLQQRGLTDTVVNAGLPGEDTAGGLTRINSVLNGPGDTLLLMEGTNDINAKTVSNETIAANLDQMAQKAEAVGWKVVHASIIPRLPTANHDKDNADAADLAAQIRDLAWSKARGMADPFEVFTTVPGGFESLYAGGDDKLHPNAAGYLLLAQVFRDVLVGLDTVPPVPGEFSPANGATDVPAQGPFTATLYDFGQGIDLTRSSLLINGSVVAATTTGDAKKLTFTYAPTTPLLGQITMTVRGTDLNIPANGSDHVLSTFVTQGTVFLPGDLNRDGRVDGADLVRFAIAFGSRKGETRFLPAADLNGDDRVDGLDFAILASNFGRSSF